MPTELEPTSELIYIVFERTLIDGDEVNNDSTNFDNATDALNYIAQRVATWEPEGYVTTGSVFDEDDAHEDMLDTDDLILSIEVAKSDDDKYLVELVSREA